MSKRSTNDVDVRGTAPFALSLSLRCVEAELMHNRLAKVAESRGLAESAGRARGEGGDEASAGSISAGSIWRAVANHVHGYKAAKRRVYGYPPTTARFKQRYSPI